MHKIFFTIVSFVLSAQVAIAAGDMTKTDFTIELAPIDPFGRGGTTPKGGDALFVVLTSISQLLLFMIPVIAIISTLIAGYYYIFSAGDSEKAGRAKNIVKWNIIAIIIAFMSWSIIQLIASLFSPQ